METKYYIAIGLDIVVIILAFLVPTWMDYRDNKKWMKRNK